MTTRAGPAFVDTLRLSERERRELLAALDRRTQENVARNRRSEDRLAYEPDNRLLVSVMHPGGTRATFLIWPRNLSRFGIGFLHGSFVYPGSDCSVILRGRDGSATAVGGKIARCQHVRGRVHEVGVRFARPLRLADFVEPPSECPAETPSVPLPQLCGQVLYVDDSADQHHLMRFLLDGFGVGMRSAWTANEGLKLARELQSDIVIVELALPGIAGAELARALRSTGFKHPVIAATADPRPEMRSRAAAAGFADLLVKPFELRSVAELLVSTLPTDSAAPAGPLLSTKWSQVRMRPAILGFLGRLGTQVEILERRIATAQNKDALHICMALKGTAAGFGYAAITEAARELADLLLREVEPDQVRRQFEELSRVCTLAVQGREVHLRAGDEAA